MRSPANRLFPLALAVTTAMAGCHHSAGMQPGTEGRAGAARSPQGAADAGAAAARATAPVGEAAPATEHVVRMLADSRGYRFEPLSLEIRQGDKVRFVMVSGGPHNIAFDTAGVPESAKARLAENTSSSMGNFMGPMLLNPDEAYIVSFAGLPPGTYRFHCLPHLAMGQRGTITVR